MDNELIFEHLVNAYIMQGHWADLYRGASVVGDNYRQGFKVGAVNTLLSIALKNLFTNANKEEQIIINDCMNKLQSSYGFDIADGVISELSEKGIVF